ncbi:MAG: OmpA family protein [Flavobacteriaceae bacterium]|nr:OmpA family protein [Flavobacteriaceae bacterium]
MKKITVLLLFGTFFLNNIQAQVYTVKKSNVNTKYSDFGITYYGDTAVVFSSSRKNKFTKNRLWAKNKQPYLDLYLGSLDKEGKIVDVKYFSKELNSKFHESNVAFSKDFKTIYFSRNNYLDKRTRNNKSGINLIQLYRAQINDNGIWSDIEPLPFNSDNYQTGHPVLNNKGDKLYFVSDMPGSIGLTDIYVVAINTDGSFGKPKNLGSTINTKNSELFPFIDENDVLYYASNGLNATSDLDIYMAKPDKKNNYSSPVRLKSPINSDKDDFAFVLKKGGKQGFLSSNREGGKGDDDIYRFLVKIVKPIKVVESPCIDVIKGIAVNKETHQPLVGVKIFLINNKKVPVDSLVTTSDGVFKFKTDCGKSYNVIGNIKGFKPESKSPATIDNKLKKRTLEFIPEFVIKNKKTLVKINKIYFNNNSSLLTNKAKIELLKVVKLMNKYPNMKIKAASYTDLRGARKYNLWLSERRAKSTVTYLIAMGINPHRITYKGYGETQLVSKCSNGVQCTEREYQLDRRTEFIIVNLEAIK